MRRLAAAFLFLSLAACSSGWNPHAIDQVQVTNEDLRGHSADNPYVIDMTRGGTIYEVPDGVDQSSIDVLVNAELPVGVFTRQSGPGGRLFLGDISDLSDIDFGFPADVPDGPSVEVECSKDKDNVNICTCKGKRDCNDMKKAGVCASNSTGCGYIRGQKSCACMAK